MVCKMRTNDDEESYEKRVPVSAVQSALASAIRADSGLVSSSGERLAFPAYSVTIPTSS